MAGEEFFGPFSGGGIEDFTPTISSNTEITPQMESAANRIALGSDYGFGSKVLAVAGGTIPDLVDTLSASVGLTERGQLNDDMLNAIGVPGLRTFYEGNKGAIQIGSGVAAIIAADRTAGRFLRPAGAAMRAVSRLPYVGRVATLDRQYNVALQLAQRSNLRMARTGQIGVEQYVGQTSIARLGQAPIVLTHTEGRNLFTRAAITRGLARNVSTEAILAATANENEFLFSDDLSENLLWMAAGLGVGGLIDRFMSIHQLKRFANSDVMNREFAKAYDPTGTESARIAANLADFDSITGSTNHFGYLRGHFTDLLTSYKISADEGRNAALVEGGTRNPLAGRRGRLSTQQDEEVRNLANKVTTGGIGGVPGSGFGMKAVGFGNHIDYALHRDAGALYGVEELGAAGEGMTSRGISMQRKAEINDRLTTVMQTLNDNGTFVTRKWKDKAGKAHEKRVLKELKPDERDALQSEYRALVYRNSLTEMHLIDGEWVPVQAGRLFDDYVEPEIVRESIDDYQVWQVAGRGPENQIGISTDLEVILPKHKKLGSLGFHDSLALYRSSQKLLRWFESTGNIMPLPRKPNWFQLDMAEALVRKTGKEESVAWPAGFNREEAQIESFRQKVKAIAKTKSLRNADLERAMVARYEFNLPRMNSYEAGLMGSEEHPIEVLIRGSADRDLSDITYSELVKGLHDIREVSGMTELAKDRGDVLSGNMFDFMVDDSGNIMKPLIGYKRQFAPFQWTKDDLAERLAMRKAYFRGQLTNESAGKMTKEVTDNLLNDPDFIAASQVTGLQDSQLQSMLPGFSSAAPQSVRGSVLNDVVQREWRDRDNPTLLAAARLRDKMERKSRQIMQQRIESMMGDVITRINGPRNGSSKLLANQFFTFRSGWDLKVKKTQGVGVAQTKSTTLPDGRQVQQFLLDPKSVHNQNRFKQTYGRELTENDVLLNPQGKPVGVDDLAYEFITRFERVARDINVEKNTLNRAMGLGGIETVPVYAPPPNTRGKYIGFSLDINNKPVPNGTVVASTPEEFARLRANLEDPNNKFSPLNQPGTRFMTQDEVTDFNTIWDEAQMAMIDPGTTAIQPSKRAKGNLLGQEINPEAVEDALVWARDSYLKQGHDIMQNIFKDQIIAAQTRAQIARESKRNAISGLREAKNRSIYDFYTENLLGRMAISSPGSLTGQLTQPVEDWINHALRGAKPVVSRKFRAAMDWTRAHKPWDDSKKSKEAYNRLVETLGEHMPFDNVSQMIEKQYAAKRPRELAEITGNMSRFEAAMRLRMFEVIHPLMNLSGIINAMPAVIRAMQPIRGESADEFARRTGNLAQVFELSPDRKIGVFDMPRLIYRTFKATWNRERHADWQFMQGHGYVTQEVAEFQRQFGAIKSREGWRAFMLGDPNSTGIRQKGLVGWVSVLSDRSEDFSRSWGHMAGLELADTLGITGREARHSFAHDIANKMIANYDPKNRPAIFQGALGAPIGLFQSFIWNYYQRLFRYIETGDARSAAIQYATQSTLFGLHTVPGFNLVNKLFFDHSDGENSPMDAIYERFGESAGDVLFGGVLSNLPKIVNILPGEQGAQGVDLYSRGDTNVRLPGFSPPPFFDTVKRVINGVTQGVAAFSMNNPDWTDNQVAEIMSNMLTNRPVAGFIETMFAAGYDTDNYGQVVAEAQDHMEATARIIGIRSLRQSKELEAFYTNKNAQSHQRALMANLNQSARAAIRSGNMSSLPGYYEEYIRRGGDPRRFNQWMRRNAEAALESRGERQLEDFSKNPQRVELMERLMDFGVSVEESDRESMASNPYEIPLEPGMEPYVDLAPIPEEVGYNDLVLEQGR